jgi:hypothetical protein
VFEKIAAGLACILAGAALAVSLLNPGTPGIQGPPGPQGPAGARGSQGPQGATQQVQQLTQQVQQLQKQVSSLTVPSDPLAAYTDICHSEFTNGSTGALQTYYYPCTNVVQTIPQPGN